MDINPHKNTTTTPKIRQATQQSDKSERALATEYKVTIDTIRCWRKHQDMQDRSHTLRRLQTTLTAVQLDSLLPIRY